MTECVHVHEPFLIYIEKLLFLKEMCQDSTGRDDLPRVFNENRTMEVMFD